MISFRMKKNISGFITMFALWGTSSLLHAQSVGTTTADILKINQGTRPAGMGGSYTAMGDDAYSANYNPAGLFYIKSFQLVVLHFDSLADIPYEFGTFAASWGGNN